MLRAKAHFKIDPMKTSTALSSSPLSQIGLFPFVLFFTTEWPVILYSGLRSAIYQHFKREKMCAERTNHNIRNIFARTLFIFIGAHFTASSNTFCISAVLAVMWWLKIHWKSFSPSSIIWITHLFHAWNIWNGFY